MPDQEKPMPTTKAQPKKSPKKAQNEGVSEEFAVIATGGKQYRVAVGDTVTIEKIKGEHKKGDKVTFDNVLLVDNGSDTTIGMPYIAGAKVEGEIASVGRAPKVMVIKYKQKSRYFKKNGHRQPFFKVTINSIA